MRRKRVAGRIHSTIQYTLSSPILTSSTFISPSSINRCKKCACVRHGPDVRHIGDYLEWTSQGRGYRRSTDRDGARSSRPAEAIWRGHGTLTLQPGEDGFTHRKSERARRRWSNVAHEERHWCSIEEEIYREDLATRNSDWTDSAVSNQLIQQKHPSEARQSSVGGRGHRAPARCGLMVNANLTRNSRLFCERDANYLENSCDLFRPNSPAALCAALLTSRCSLLLSTGGSCSLCSGLGRSAGSTLSRSTCRLS